MCSELCKDFYVVYQLEMVAGEVESSCQLVVTFFFFFLVSPYQTIEISLGQPSPPSYQLLPPPLCVTIDALSNWSGILEFYLFNHEGQGEYKRQIPTGVSPRYNNNQSTTNITNMLPVQNK